MAYDPKNGLVFIPAMEVPFGYGTDPHFAYRDGGWNVGIDYMLMSLPSDRSQIPAIRSVLKGELIAWDPVRQEARWTVRHDYFWNAGVLATAGGLVFQGTAEGRIRAYDSATGKEVWSTDAGNGVIAPPMTYSIGGIQYLAVMAGYGGAAPLAASEYLPNQPRKLGRLLVFKLGGSATAPAFAATLRPTIDVAALSSNGDPALGVRLFQSNCAVCHSSNASGAFVVNLKTSPMIASEDNFLAVVRDGALAHQGMVSFAKYLKPAQIEDVRAYLITEAKAASAATQATR
jgi:mono/diheme cytochrome c family protein